MEGKRILWICGFLTVFTIAMFTMMFMTMKDDKKALQLANEQRLKEQLVSSNCSVTRDSLFRINSELSKYKTLTQAMVHRDEVTNQLKHKVGDIVRMKNDSAKVVIEDVLIGGGKYNYYVKFKVLYKDQTTKEVTPELIY